MRPRLSVNGLILIVILAACLVGCVSDPIATSTTNNPKINVELVVIYDGCKVYRFNDGARYVYFVKCVGDANVQAQTYWDTPEGKTTTPIRVQTVNTN